MAAFNISLSGVPTKFPTADASPLDVDFIDLSVRQSRLSDSINLSSEETYQRDSLREEILDLLHDHAEKIPINSFISHPSATVQLFYNHVLFL